MMLIDNQCLAAKVFYYNQTGRNLTEEGAEKKGEKLLRCTKKKRLPAAILKLGRSPMIDRMTVPKPISPSYF